MQNVSRSSRVILSLSLLVAAVKKSSSFGINRRMNSRKSFPGAPTRTMTPLSSEPASDSKLGTTLSPRILETLDPCVVLMKELVGQYAYLWEDKGGIFSLAQGVVYWEPPESCRQTLQEEVAKPDSLLHTYGPAQGIPELTEALAHKVETENGLSNHDIMVTVGANQAYVNCVLTCLSGNSKAVVFSPYYFNHVMALQM